MLLDRAPGRCDGQAVRGVEPSRDLVYRRELAQARFGFGGAGRVGGTHYTHSPSSFLHTGTRALISSMLSLAPAKAASPSGADAATLTDSPDSGTGPTRASCPAAAS